MTLQQTLNNLFDANTAVALAELAGLHIMAQSGAAAWLADSIEPLAAEAAAKLGTLEAALAGTKEAAAKALAVADQAAILYDQAEQDDLEAAELRKKTSNAADAATAEAHAAVARIKEAKSKAADLAGVVQALRDQQPPQANQVRALVERASRIRPAEVGPAVVAGELG